MTLRCLISSGYKLVEVTALWCKDEILKCERCGDDDNYDTFQISEINNKTSVQKRVHDVYCRNFQVSYSDMRASNDFVLL